MIHIILNNNKFKLQGNLKVINKVYEDLKIRHPNAFYIRPYMEPGWDGKVKFLSDAGYAKTGLLPTVIDKIDEYGDTYKIIDKRVTLKAGEVRRDLGFFKLRKYQIKAVESIVYNTLGEYETPFHRGVIAAATNAGKTLIGAGIHLSFEDAKTIILMDNSQLYDQFLADMPQIFGSHWGYMRGKEVVWGDIMVCMVQTLYNRIGDYQHRLMDYNICIFDECHLVTSKSRRIVMEKLYNTSVRVGLSGTPFKHKDKIKNMNVRAFFGDITYEISNLDLIEKGYSSNVIIKIIKGNEIPKIKTDYKTEYDRAITDSDYRTQLSIERAKFYLKRKQYPMLIIGKYHRHVENLYEAYNNSLGDKYRIEYIHGEVKDRTKKLNLFKEGKIDILISSLIIKIGQNMPLMRYMQNAASGDSHINALQLLGRILRKHKSKNKVYYEDFYDIGYYLEKHSKHRIKYYKAEGVKVLELYKK